MGEDSSGVKLCDNRFIYTESDDMKQKLADTFQGPRITGRKYPAMSSPENVVEDSAWQQKLFIMGGIDTSGKIINDQGYYMLDL